MDSSGELIDRVDDADDMACARDTFGSGDPSMTARTDVSPDNITSKHVHVHLFS